MKIGNNLRKQPKHSHINDNSKEAEGQNDKRKGEKFNRRFN